MSSRLNDLMKKEELLNQKYKEIKQQAALIRELMFNKSANIDNVKALPGDVYSVKHPYGIGCFKFTPKNDKEVTIVFYPYAVPDEDGVLHSKDVYLYVDMDITQGWGHLAVRKLLELVEEE